MFWTLRLSDVSVVISPSRLEWFDKLQKLQFGIKPETLPWAGLYPKRMGSSKLKHVMLEGGFKPVKVECHLVMNYAVR